ncbi:MAG: DUF1861 family protein [Bacillus cereus]|uniref:DUF1861 family protein n=1 Tax=Vagococcus fluvialis TaxID=2738 RepID=UPI0028497EBB|nr:DUF1861 family protein [Bacillus cereus]
MIKVENLLKEHRKNKNKNIKNVEKLVFDGVGNRDIYNITAPFEFQGETIIAARVEKRDSELSEIHLFKPVDNRWIPLENSIVLNLQDPFVTVIRDRVVLGGVEVFFDTDKTSWRTVFYYLNKIDEVEKFFEGPIGMKDLRLKELPNKQILVLTRPQGQKGGRGKIGSFVINSIEELSTSKIDKAPLLNNQFIAEEWGGANELHIVNNIVVVLSHIANFDAEGNRHYYAMLFDLNKDYTAVENPRIIAEREDFLPGEAKRADLEDVVFSGGLIINENVGVLYAGISDAEAQKIEIRNLFN